MNSASQFQSLIDSIESMNDEDQEMLVTIIQKRLQEKRRQDLINQVKETQHDFKNGHVKRGSVADLMEDVLSCED